MKYTYQQFKAALPDMSWSIDQLADKLSVIGHETEVDGDVLDVTLTTNRKDCKELRYLAFDLAGIYNLNVTEKPDLTAGVSVTVNLDYINKLLGATLNSEQYQQLKRLGFEVGEDTVVAPGFRTDIATAADIAEELFRLYGVSAVTLEPLENQPAVESTPYLSQLKIKGALVNVGFTETQTYSFTKTGQVELKNSFTQDEPYLRPTLLDGLLKTLAKNPYMKRIGFFELGDIYLPEETTYLGVVIAGYKNPDSFAQKINQALSVQLQLEPVSAETLATFDIKQPQVYFGQIPLKDIDAKSLPAVAVNRLPQFQPISKYPPLVRDITVEASLADSIESATAMFPELLLNELVDSYVDEASGKKTLTYRFLFQKLNGSFTDDQIQAIDTKLQGHFSSSAT